MTDAIAVLRQQGAVIVDPADIPSVVDPDPHEELPAVGHVRRRATGQGRRRGLLDRAQVRHEARLQQVAGVARARRAGQDADRAARLEHRAQERRRDSSTDSRTSTSPTRWTSEDDRARYEADRAKDIRLSATHGIDEVMKAQQLDALLFPGGSGAAIAAKPGYPTVIVPFALIPNAPDAAFPAGFNAKPQPFGVALHRHGLQRAEAARDRVRVRAGHEEEGASDGRALRC